MKPVIIISFGSMGDVFPYVEIAKNLLPYSYEIIFMAPKVYEESISSALSGHINFRFEAIGIENDFKEDASAFGNALKNSQGGNILKMAKLILKRGEKYNHIIRRKVLEIIEGSDLLPIIVYHPFFAKVCADFASNHSMKVVEINHLFFPSGHNFILELLPRRIREKVIQRVLGTQNFSLQRPLKKIGLFPAWHILRGYQDLIRSERVELMGYINFTQRNHAFKAWKSSLDRALDDFLENRIPVVATFGTETGTSKNKKLLFNRCAEVCRKLDVPLILLCRNEEEIPPITSSEIFIAPFIPLARLLPKAAILIHHGGMGTSTTALQCQTPQIVIPSGYDQFYNAKLVTTRKVGETVTQSAMQKSSIALQNKVKYMLEHLDQYRISIPLSLQDEPDGALLAAEEIYRLANMTD